MSALAVRAARPEDCEALARLFVRAVREVASRDYRPAQIDAWASIADDIGVWTERMRHHVVWVAEISGRFAGFAQFEPPDQDRKSTRLNSSH